MMSRMIRNKELKALYGGFAGWAAAAIMILAVGIGVLIINFNGNDIRIAQALDTLLPMYAVIIPLLTMGTVSNEVQKGTIQYIDAIPGAGKALVLGKFQALLIAFSLPFIVICLIPIIFSLYGEVQWISSYAGIFAFWLLGIALMAFGVLVSAYSDNGKVAAAVIFCVIAIDYLLPSASQMLPEGILPEIVKNLSLFHHYRYYAVNFVNVTALIIYVLVAVLCLLLAVRRMNNRRVQKDRKYMGWALTAVALVLCILVNMLPSSLTMIDRSPSKMITLSDTSKEVLENLEMDVEIWYVAKHGEENRTVEQILERCEDISDRITVKQVEGSAEEYTAGAVIVRANNSTLVLKSLEMYEYDYSNYMTNMTVDAYYIFERALLSTIYSMTSSKAPVFYWVTNHMEMELEDSMESYIYQSGMRLDEMNLEEDAIPEDAAGIIISSPAFDFSENEVERLAAYLDQGGYLMLLTDMSGLEMPNLDALMEKYGVQKQNGLIIEGSTNHIPNAEYPYYIVPDLLQSELVASMGTISMPAVMAMAHGIELTGEQKDSVTVTPVMQTSELAYMKFGIEIASLEPSEGDMMGPMITAVTVEDAETGARIEWFGSSSMLVEACNEMVSNTDIAMVCAALKTTGDYSTVEMEDKLMVAYEMELTEGASGKWSLLLLGLPLIFLVIGMLNMARRNR